MHSVNGNLSSMFSGSSSLSYYSPKNMAIWLSMAFQAGAINSGGFLACHRFVTHTTGFATFFGTEVAQGNMMAALGMLTVPIFFLIGSMLSAYFVDRRIALGKPPLYFLMFLSMSVTMIAVSVVGIEGFFGVFGTTYEGSNDYILLAALCLCSGIQNATITSASGAVVRTTHLTGITTDLGIGLIRTSVPGQNQELIKKESRSNKMRASIILAFVFGSAISAFAYFRVQYLGFLGPALISFCLFLISFNSYRSYLKQNTKEYSRV